MQFFTVTKVLGAIITFGGIVASATLPVVDLTTRSVDLTTNGTLAKWTVPFHGENITLFGEASSVIAQLKELDPEWVPAVNDDFVVHDSVVDRREALADNQLCCPVAGWGWNPAPIGDVNNAINQMGSMNGLINVNRKSCTTVSQWGAAGIWLCNNGVGDWETNVLWVQFFAHEFGNCITCGQRFSGAFGSNINLVIHHT